MAKVFSNHLHLENLATAPQPYRQRERRLPKMSKDRKFTGKTSPLQNTASEKSRHSISRVKLMSAIQKKITPGLPMAARQRQQTQAA